MEQITIRPEPFYRESSFSRRMVNKPVEERTRDRNEFADIPEDNLLHTRANLTPKSSLISPTYIASPSIPLIPPPPSSPS